MRRRSSLKEGKPLRWRAEVARTQTAPRPFLPATATRRAPDAPCNGRNPAVSGSGVRARVSVRQGATAADVAARSRTTVYSAIRSATAARHPNGCQAAKTPKEVRPPDTPVPAPRRQGTRARSYLQATSEPVQGRMQRAKAGPGLLVQDAVSALRYRDIARWTRAPPETRCPLRARYRGYTRAAISASPGREVSPKTFACRARMCPILAPGHPPCGRQQRNA